MSNYGVSSFFLPKLLSNFKKSPIDVHEDDRGKSSGQSLVLNITVDENGTLNGVVGNPGLEISMPCSSK